MDLETAIARVRESLSDWLLVLASAHLWIQVGLIVLAGGIAWLVKRQWKRLYRRMTEDPRASHIRRLVLDGVDRVMLPLLFLIGTNIALVGLTQLDRPAWLVQIANTLLASFFVIRLAIYILDKTFRPGPVLKAWENTFTFLVFAIVALYLLGWLDATREALDSLAFSIGDLRISVLSVLNLALAAAMFLLLATWLARLTQRQIMRAEYITITARIGLAKFTKFVLYTLAVLVALNAVGINLTTLTVLSGAIGVGIGFGLQRIIANFLSGFILVMDRSIKQGDVITMSTGSFGWVQALKARYVVIRDRDGVETLIPNENLLTTEVINWSHSDKKVRLKIPVSISYGDDPEQAMELLIGAAEASERVLEEPPPVARLMRFGDNGIELELRIWIQDPQDGVNNVRSDINVAIWRAFKDAGITIPFPQRDVHLRQVSAAD